MTPNEWDSRHALNKFKSQFQNTCEYPNNFFLASVEKYAERILNGWRMEYFYREIRKQTGYLMDGDTPLGGQWNYDKEKTERNFQSTSLYLKFLTKNLMKLLKKLLTWLMIDFLIILENLLILI